VAEVGVAEDGVAEDSVHGSAESAGHGGAQRVVVGIDGSAGARAALTWALVEAARRRAEVEVLSSIPVDFYWDDAALHSDGGVDRVQVDTEARARALVDQVRQDPAVASMPGASDVPVAVSVVVGPPAEALVDRADGADLLVVGSRGRGVARSTVLGSVALHCVTHAHCPVVVVHPSRTALAGTGTVVVGLDDSDTSRAALRAAVADAARRGAGVEAVLVYEPPNPWSELYTLSTAAGETPEQARGRAEKIVADALGADVDASAAVSVVALEGPPGAVLARRAEDAALLVVGSKSRSTLRGLLLGSVALDCVVHAPVPVMVVHPEDVPREPAAASGA
jgi:nucleotide-binding universal stress UspA family protein